MVGIDYWPQEEGYIVEGAPVMMCLAGGAIAEMATVKLSATAAGVVTVAASAAAGDSQGVALRAAASGAMVPVAFKGIVKMIVGGTLALGAPCISNGATDPNTSEVCDTGTSADVILGDNGTQRILGLTLQAGVTLADEILVLLGRW